MKVTVVNINNFSFPKFNVNSHYEKHDSIHIGSIIECEEKKLVVKTVSIQKDGSVIIEAM